MFRLFRTRAGLFLGDPPNVKNLKRLSLVNRQACRFDSGNKIKVLLTTKEKQTNEKQRLKHITRNEHLYFNTHNRNNNIVKHNFIGDKMKCSLINVIKRSNNLVSGYWLQDCFIENAEDLRKKINTANGNKLNIAIVEQIRSTTPQLNLYTNLKVIK